MLGEGENRRTSQHLFKHASRRYVHVSMPVVPAVLSSQTGIAGKRIRCAKCQNVFAVPPAVSEPSEIDPLGSGFDDPLGGFGDLSDEGPALGSPTAPRSAPTTPRRQSFGGVML
ncbi:MAG: hypothetical protein R3C99_25250 [Pirellulaceae bacterium]